MLRIQNNRLIDARYIEAASIGPIIKPVFVTMHYTAGYTADSAISVFRNPKSGVSAHLILDRDGTWTQMVPFNRRANHAGPSIFQGVQMLNNHSIGIEMVNIGWARKRGDGRLVDSYNNVVSSAHEPDSWIAAPHPRVGSGMLYWQPYTHEQIEAAIELIKALIPLYPLRAVCTHEEIDTRGWKTDPGPAFPMSRMYSIFRGVEQDQVVGLTYTVKPEALNMRQGPGTTFTPIAVLKRGDKVKALSERDGWAEVDAMGRVGWVRRDLVA